VPDTTYSVLFFGHLFVAAALNVTLRLVVPPLGLHVMVPPPPARLPVAPLAVLLVLLAGLHFEIVNVPEMVPLSLAQAGGAVAPAEVADRPTATKDTGSATVATVAAIRNKRFIRSLPLFCYSSSTTYIHRDGYSPHTQSEPE
jgi:hypothetical protein